MKNLFIVGSIGSAHGILGWNYINSYTEIKNNILNYQPWFITIENILQNIYIEKKKIYNNRIYVKFKHINNRNQSIQLTNKIIQIKKKQLPILKNCEYYWKDILYCSVFNIQKIFIGVVIQILRSKKNDILVIEHHNTLHKKKILIPFIEKIFIKKIDLFNKNIYINEDIL
ncbi:ribosome maturation factor RimM [Buchnera aphidicola]|uniref:ribosome maturation factor RimM n=1 Tax=Buchnera aphidicola TaxID=9 RepID=UPI003464389F